VTLSDDRTAGLQAKQQAAGSRYTAESYHERYRSEFDVENKPFSV